MFSTGLDHLAVLHIELLALYTYFQTSKSLEAGLAVYSEGSIIFQKREKVSSAAHEHLHQARTQLLVLHQKHTKLFRPAITRECLIESISLFPNNTIFLTAYASNEARFRLDDRVRSVLSDVVLSDKHKNVIGWCFAIWNELQRGIEFGGTSHAVRAVFEKAVQRTANRSLMLWTAYFLFEHSGGHLQKAKQVFFRGLTSLPWAKWFAMLAFDHLEGELGFEEMRNVWNVLGERDLRIYVDIQGFLKEMDEERGLKRRRVEN